MNQKAAARRRWDKRGKRRNEQKARMVALEAENIELKALIQELEAQLQQAPLPTSPSIWGGFNHFLSSDDGGPFSARGSTASGRFA